MYNANKSKNQNIVARYFVLFLPPDFLVKKKTETKRKINFNQIYKKKITSVGLGITIYHGCAYGIIVGMNEGLCTCLAQILGAKKYPLICITLHKAQMINLLFALLISPMFIYSEEILLFCEINQEICYLSSLFIKWSFVDLVVSIF